MAQKPGIPKGTRDFSPTEVTKRNYIFSTIKQVFEIYGFQPIETPSFENSATLMGKYGDEGDRLIFKILESGDYYSKFRNKYKTYKNEFSKIIFEILKANQSYLKDFKKGIINIENNNEVTNYANSIRIKVENQLKGYINIKYPNDRVVKGIFSNDLFIEKILLSVGNSERRLIAFVEMDSKKLLRKSKDIFDNYFEFIESQYITPLISEKALRYDLTVPFARYVVQHQNDIVFPFKRYQMQPVWRADRPQKGRFREFYQCDADVVGSKGLLQEVEFVQLYDAVFSKLKLSGTTIKLNNRKILAGIAEIIGAKDKLIDFTVALDKLDKIGEEGVTNEMLAKGISAEAIEKVQPLFRFNGSNQEKLDQLQELLAASEEGTQGVEDLRFVVDAIEALGLQSATLELDVTLARGLNYYTGAIYEVSAPEGVQMGSIGGGGRYDDLTGIFGLKDVSGVGISFGLDRIYLVLEELNLFDEVELPTPKVLFVNFGKDEATYCMKALVALRDKGIKSELYPDSAKMKKQLNYANRRKIPFVIMVGSTEMESNKYTLKNMKTGEQQLCNLEELLEITTSY